MNTPSLPLDANPADLSLAQLSDSDKQRLLAWLDAHSYEEVRKLAAQPRPEGLDLHTNSTALFRYYSEAKRAQILATRQATLAVAAELASPKAEPVPELTPVMLQSLEEKALRELLNPATPLKEQAHLIHLVLKVARLQQTDRRTAILDRDQQSRQRRASAYEEDVRQRRQSRDLAAQRLKLEVLKTLRDQFPVLSQINWDFESQDAQALERLKQMFGLDSPARQA